MIELLQILFFSFLFTSFFYLPYYSVLTIKNKIYFSSLADKNILNILILGNLKINKMVMTKNLMKFNIQTSNLRILVT